MLSLFAEIELDECVPVFDRDLLFRRLDECDLPGLDLMLDFVSRDEESFLIDCADRGAWSNHWKRRTQYYGHRYGSEGGEGRREIPAWAVSIRERLVERGVFPELPPQMGINEYLPGQGIAPHVDYLEGTVVSLSLGSGCVMDFKDQAEPRKCSLYLPPRSIVMLNGLARYQWTHGIAPRLRDNVEGRSLARQRRISLTFRSVAPR
jgi:alkylated DNA repair dioxygenase AlkB